MIYNYWNTKLQDEVKSKPSLEYFNPSNCSVKNTHLIYSTSIGNPYETNKAIIQAKMICGQYPVENLTGKFKKDPNPQDFMCQGCDSGQVGTLQHLLLHCEGVKLARD